MENKEIMRCVRILSNIVAAYGDAEDQLYIFTACFIRLAQNKWRNEQAIMRKCRAAVGCLIGALVPHEYFDDFMADISLLEDDIYNEEPCKKVNGCAGCPFTASTVSKEVQDE